MLFIFVEPGNVQSSVMICEKPVFGVPLAVAVERSKCHDGIELPAIFRECIDHIEEHGKSITPFILS